MRVENINAANLENALRNTILFASTDKALPVLNAVQVHARDGEVTTNATDRYVLGYARAQSTDVTVIHEPGTVLLSVADCKDLANALKAERDRTDSTPVNLTHDRGNGKVTATFPWTGAQRTYLAVEGDYPKIRALFPDRVPSNPVAAPWAMSPKILKVIASLKDHRGRRGGVESVTFAPTENPSKPLPFMYGDWFRGLAMPIRLTDDVEDLAPAWMDTARVPYGEGEAVSNAA